MGSVSVLSFSNLPLTWLVWKRPPSAEVLTLACRATFTLSPGVSQLAPVQEPASQSEQAYPDGSSRGVYVPSDRAPLKPRADVVLVGQAHSPGQRPVHTLVTRLLVGEIDKRVEVSVDRWFDLDGHLMSGPRFTTMPLVYERAAGGPDTQNPLGVRHDARDMYGRSAVPNLTPAGAEITSRQHKIPVTCFGPIAASWPSRRALYGASAQLPSDFSGQILPSDLNPAFFNVAPLDQQLATLRDDTSITLEGLHPEHAELVTRLSGVRPKAFLEDKAVHPMALRPDTLWIDSTRGICTLTWRGQAPIDPNVPTKVLVATEAPGQTLTWEDVDRLRAEARRGLQSSAASGLALDKTVDAPRAAKHKTLPFSQSQVAERLGLNPPPAPPPSSTGGLPFSSSPPPADASPWARGAPVTSSPAPPSAGVTSVPSAPQPRSLSPAPFVAPVASSVPVASSMPVVSAAPEAAVKPTHALVILGFEASALPELRRDPRFSPLMDAMNDAPPDPELDARRPGEDVAAAEDRREITEMLARGEPATEEGLVALLEHAIRPDGRVITPLALVAGDMLLPFDEHATLKATVSTASAHMGTDAEARESVALARDYLASPGAPSAPPVAEGLAKRIRETFEKRGLLPAAAIADHAGKALLGGRHHVIKKVFGGPHLRALLASVHSGGAGAASGPSAPAGIPMYLGEALARALPVTERLRVRAVVEVRAAIDANEAHRIALRPVALAMLAPLPAEDKKPAPDAKGRR